jgi:hypothetical protein
MNNWIMKNNQTIQSLVKIKFAEMQTKEHLLDLLNFVRTEIFGVESHPFKISQLTWAYNNTSNAKYRSFSIKKKDGRGRSIHAPVKTLKYLQKSVAFVLHCVFEPHVNAYGFIPGKSIVDNASRHSQSRYVYNIDLKDFFPTIDQARVWKCFQLRPFNLNETNATTFIEFSKESIIKPIHIASLNTLNNQLQKHLIKTKYIGYNFFNGFQEAYDKNGGRIKYNIVPDIKEKLKGNIFIIRAESTSNLVSHEVELNDDNLKIAFSIILSHQYELSKVSRKKLANVLAAICCTSMEVERKNSEGNFEKIKKNVLPQGAPTSPVVTNIVCQRLDYLLSGLANRFGLRYTRYADDITFSSNHNVYGENGDFITELRRIIKDQKFEIKESKTRLQKAGYRQEVTGLLVNVQPNVQKRYIKKLRSWLYIWEKFGYSKATSLILTSYLKDKGHVRSDKVKIENLIRGKLDYLKMVKGEDNQLYLKLFSRFDYLLKNNLLRNQISNFKNDLDRIINIKDNSQIIIYSNQTKNNFNFSDDINTNLILKKSQNTLSNNLSQIIENIIEIGLDKAMDQYKPQ